MDISLTSEEVQQVVVILADHSRSDLDRARQLFRGENSANLALAEGFTAQAVYISDLAKKISQQLTFRTGGKL